jgi:hypothetical protein
MCAMDDGYLRSGAPPAGARKGAKKELALLRSHCLGTPTAALRYRISGCLSPDLAFPDSFRLLAMSHIPSLSSLDQSLMVLSFPPLTIHAASLVTSALKTGPE